MRAFWSEDTEILMVTILDPQTGEEVMVPKDEIRHKTNVVIVRNSRKVRVTEAYEENEGVATGRLFSFLG